MAQFQWPEQLILAFLQFFEGIDSLTNSYEVSIKLRKPDLSGSEYPVLLMNSTSKVF